jgi:hypothetical protein
VNPYGPAYDKKIGKKQHDLERQVLQYLKDNRGEPHNYELLCVLFDFRRTGEIAPVLYELRQWQCIAVDKAQNVTITESGLTQLQRWE